MRPWNGSEGGRGSARAGLGGASSLSNGLVDSGSGSPNGLVDCGAEGESNHEDKSWADGKRMTVRQESTNKC